MADNRLNSVWNTVPGIIEKLKECIDKRLSAKLTAIELGHGLTRNACMSKAGRCGWSFESQANRPPAKPRVRRRASFVSAQFPAREPSNPIAPMDIPKQEDFLGLTFWELKNNSCRFMNGEGLDATYCGQPKTETTSYCSFHHGICFNPPYPRRSIAIQ
jgi:hypothetical protein